VKSSFFALIPALFFLFSLSSADTPLIRTTVTDSSRVVFIAQTPLSWESVEYDTIVYAFNSVGNPLTTLGFPITLPDGVDALGGFAIGDIDRDSKVEIVFGTSDGYLHCWELGACSIGYAPWTQFKHDNRRSGVLE
jgi:hypothetical protein